MRQGNTTVTEALKQLHTDPLEIKLALDNKLRVDHVRTMPNIESIALNESANNILRLAVLEARRQHKTEVDVQHLMLAILHDFANNGAKMVLEENNVTYNKFLLLTPRAHPKILSVCLRTARKTTRNWPTLATAATTKPLPIVRMAPQPPKRVNPTMALP